MMVSWQQPGSSNWMAFGANSAGAEVMNANGCVCQRSSGVGRCKHVAAYDGTDELEINYSCKATDESKAGCLGEYTLHWPEDLYGDGHQSCLCTAQGHTVDHHDRSRKCEFTPADSVAGTEATCTGQIIVCPDNQNCRWTDCAMEEGPPNCKFECWPPPGVCLASDQNQGTMCGDEARCERNYRCWEDCEEPCYQASGWDESTDDFQECIAECRQVGQPCYRRCDACRQRESDCNAQFWVPTASDAFPGYEGCWAMCGTGMQQSQGGPCGDPGLPDGSYNRGACHDDSVVVYDASFGEFFEGQFPAGPRAGQGLPRADQAIECHPDTCLLAANPPEPELDANGIPIPIDCDEGCYDQYSDLLGDCYRFGE
jgi:hypothetical protein